MSKMAEFFNEGDFNDLFDIERRCNDGDADDMKLVHKVFEAKICKKFDKLKVLRSMCLFSCTQNGFEEKAFNHLRKVFICNYGYNELVTLMNLEECGLLVKKPNLNNPLKKNNLGMSWDWKNVKETFRLMSIIDKVSPSDISFVYGGFCPLSVRLIMLTFGGRVFNAQDKDGDEMMKHFNNPGVGWLKSNSYLQKIGL